jgi:DNA-binding MarR family transcriptional regulator
VERTLDPTDGRAKIIRLTERGWALRRVADEIVANLEEDCTRRLGEQRMRQFEGLMKDVSSVLEEDQAHVEAAARATE